MQDPDCWEKKFKPCIYSDRLLEKLLKLNEKAPEKINIIEVKKAIYYAKKYHGKQKRLSGVPYYTHPIAVASMVANHCFKTDILVTSILHDTLEDTLLTQEMIKNIFGLTVAWQVTSLTRIKLDHNQLKQKISVAEILNLLWLQNKEDLLLVKLFDRIHNIQTINFKTPEKILETLQETFKRFISLSIYLQANNPSLLKITEFLLNLCYQQLPIKHLKSLHNQRTIFSSDNFQLPLPRA